MHRYVQPEYNLSAFTCPYCFAYAQVTWENLGSKAGYSGLSISVCHRCGDVACWHQRFLRTIPVLIIPAASAAPLPHPEMPETVKQDYNEARAIVNASPRAAAALLRLSIQRLCIELGEKGRHINDDIGSLVKKGLPVGIQQALDVVRVIGNNAVHPGKLSDEDLADVAIPLFELINVIVEDRIARPKALEALYLTLPQGARDAVEDRDK